MLAKQQHLPVFPSVCLSVFLPVCLCVVYMWYVLVLQDKEAQLLAQQHSAVCLSCLHRCGVCLAYRRQRSISPACLSACLTLCQCCLYVWYVCLVYIWYVCVVYMWNVLGLQEEEAQCLCSMSVWSICVCLVYMWYVCL